MEAIGVGYQGVRSRRYSLPGTGSSPHYSSGSAAEWRPLNGERGYIRLTLDVGANFYRTSVCERLRRTRCPEIYPTEFAAINNTIALGRTGPRRGGEWH